MALGYQVGSRFWHMATYQYKERQTPAPARGLFNWVGLETLISKEIRRFMKVWQQTVLGPLVTTLLFMVIFSLALGGSGRGVEDLTFVNFLAPGLIMMTIIQNAYQNPSSSILISKVQGNIIDVLMPPLSPLELTIGYVVGGVVRGVMVGLAVYAAVIFWPGVDGAIHNFWAFFYYLFSGALLMSFAGAIAGVWAEKFDHSAGLNNFVVVPLSLLSGTFYSIQRLPDLFHSLSLLNPFFYLIDGLRFSMTGYHDGNLFTGALVVLFINAVLAIIVYRIFKTGWKLKP